MVLTSGTPESTMVELDMRNLELQWRLSGVRVCWSGGQKPMCVDVLDYDAWLYRLVSSLDRLGFDAGVAAGCVDAWLMRQPPGLSRLIHTPEMAAILAAGPGRGEGPCPHGFAARAEQVADAYVWTCTHEADSIAVAEVEGEIQWLTVGHLNDAISQARPLDPCAPLDPLHWGSPVVETHTTLAFEWAGAPGRRRLASLQFHKGALRNGPYLELWPNGKPAIVGSFADDMPHGLWVWVDSAGMGSLARLYVMGVALQDLPVKTLETDEPSWP